MTDNTAVATVSDTAAALAEQVVIKGDLSKLTEAQRMSYYSEVCRSLGLNPLTRPFEYISLNNKLVLYATRGCADQLRSIRGITITGLDPRQVGDVFVVVATGRDRTGREDSATGAVSTQGLRGEALANAMMKAETKAKRRLTLSLAGLGWSDETEIDSIPGAVHQDVDPETGEIRRPPSLAERAAAKRAAVVSPAADPLAPHPPRRPAAEAEHVEEPAIEGPLAEPSTSRVRVLPRPIDPPPPPASPDVARRSRCGAASPYDDGSTCGLPSGHLDVKGAAQLHRSLDEHGAVSASWPDQR